MQRSSLALSAIASLMVICLIMMKSTHGFLEGCSGDFQQCDEDVECCSRRCIGGTCRNTGVFKQCAPFGFRCIKDKQCCTGFCSSRPGKPWGYCESMPGFGYK